MRRIQLVEVSDSGGGEYRYEYDGQGRMIRGALPGGFTRFTGMTNPVTWLRRFCRPAGLRVLNTMI